MPMPWPVRCTNCSPYPASAMTRRAARSTSSHDVPIVAAATVGTTCEAVDAAARDRITEAGYGDHFIHRTGHGIGLEEHEDPYLVSGNASPLEPGHAFSIEPGIYLAGRYGARIEDIVVAAAGGPDALNRADHDLHVVEA